MIFDKIFGFFRNIFKGKEVKKIPDKIDIVDDNNDFEKSLKDNVVNQSKKKIRTLVCVGTGLGINDKISY